jgi:hypothetical protein
LIVTDILATDIGTGNYEAPTKPKVHRTPHTTRVKELVKETGKAARDCSSGQHKTTMRDLAIHHSTHSTRQRNRRQENQK